MGKSIHMENFLMGFGLGCTSKGASKEDKKTNCCLNMLKVVSYVPVLGTISTIGFGILLGCSKGENSAPAGTTFAWIARGLLSPLAPITLLPLDIIATLIYMVKCCKSAQGAPA